MIQSEQVITKKYNNKQKTLQQQSKKRSENKRGQQSIEYSPAVHRIFINKIVHQHKAHFQSSPVRNYRYFPSILKTSLCQQHQN